MVVIDSRNQMIPKLERLRAARDRIVIIDPFDPSPPALNNVPISGQALFTFTSHLLAMQANMQTLLDFIRIEKPAEVKASKFWP